MGIPHRSAKIQEVDYCLLISTNEARFVMVKVHGGDGGGDIVWPWAKDDDDWTPWPISRKLGADAVRALIGHKCRMVRIGEQVTGEIEPGRITILLDEHGRIQEIYKDPELPTN
ncbi:hypothetical protein D3C76_1115520 [compost metagenome]